MRTTMSIPCPRKSFVLAVIVFLFLLSSSGFAQKQNNIWYFDDSVGIDFNGPKPTVLLDGALYYPGYFTLNCPGEGVSSISDRNTGRLLFYTAGHRAVFNRKHQRMATLGDSSWCVKTVIVPLGCDTTKYAIVNVNFGWAVSGSNTGSNSPTISYVIVDMMQNGGDGAIITPPTELLKGTSERMVAIPHANGTDSWIISHPMNSKYFYSWHVSWRGINPTPVISYCDSTIGYDNSLSFDNGLMNTSPDGKYIVDIYKQSIPVLLDFDAASGKVSYNRQLTGGFRGMGIIGGCFSADNSKLYLSDMRNIFQVDLPTNTISLIDSVTASERYLLSLGPDGRIYSSSTSSNWLGVITKPDAAGLGCSFNPFGFYLGGKRSDYVWAHLPTNMNSYPNAVPGNCNKVTADFTATADCSGKCIGFSDWSNGSPTSWKWSFPGGNASSDTGQSIYRVCYDAPGVYPVKLIVNGPNGSDTLVKSIIVESGSRQATPIQIPPQHVKAGSTVEIPVSVVVSNSLGLSSTPVNQIDLALQFDDQVINITTSDLPSRITPPPGWSVKDMGISSGVLSMSFVNNINLPVSDTLNLGTMLFDAQKSTDHHITTISVQSIIIRTAKDNLNLCTDIEGSWVAQILVDSLSAAVRQEPGPENLSISPNPFSSGTAISFGISGPQHVTMDILDALGRKCIGICSGIFETGDHQLFLNAGTLSSGMYFLRMTAGNHVVIHPLFIAK